MTCKKGNQQKQSQSVGTDLSPIVTAESHHCLPNIGMTKNVQVEIMNTVIKRWADPAIPFYMRYYLNLRLETFRKD